MELNVIYAGNKVTADATCEWLREQGWDFTCIKSCYGMGGRIKGRGFLVISAKLDPEDGRKTPDAAVDPQSDN